MYAVIDQGAKTRFQNGGPVVPVVQGHSHRQGGLPLCDIVFHPLSAISIDVLVTDPEDLDQGGKLAVEFRSSATLPGSRHSPVATSADADDAAVRIGLYHDILELRAPVGLPLGPNQNIAPFGADIAGGDIHRAALYGPGNVCQGPG